MKTIINHNGCILKTQNIVTNERIAHILFDKELAEELKSLIYVKEFGRLVTYQGNKGIDYIYTNKHHPAKGWTPLVKQVSTVVRYFLQIKDTHNSINRDDIYFNHCLINQYDATMYLNSHKDNEPELTGAIASLTLGDSAWFRYGLDRNIPKQTNLQLNHGDVMIGNRKFFETYYHSVSQPINGGTRFNLTWRTICNN